MSSDTFYIEARRVSDDTVELHCTTSTAGGANDYALTRSFAVMALSDGMPYPGANPTPLQKAMQEVGGPTPPVWQESFHREHVDKFIAATELVERIGVITDERAWRTGRFSIHDEDAAEAQYPAHRFVLRVRVTNPRYLEGLSFGSSFGTTGYDSWWDDPTRPSLAEMAAIEARASLWYPHQDTASEKTAAKKAATKKPAAKKPATKKPTAKKAAAKKPATKKTTAPAAKKPATKKPAAKKPAAKKPAAKKTATKKPATKKTATAKKPTRSVAAKKTAKKPARRATAKKKASSRNNAAE
ncbi:hypothetical protein OV090_22090 [Nannocystis sp. RBIL2]|uniref:hypothetical protein n=1 Tax=Nannocystis sp. RBIL2 TaxID=2996788 RepID=UPI00226EADE4|nr:hypothetical protein [Nannocystis sp. RBIL2]MCY1067454.1 hypothetical protein [Nannocystis sp. RBIL2]